jgi:glycosyltransferase involved in cell wall biosynthesis
MKRIHISAINDLVTDQRVHRMAETLAGAGYAVCVTGRRLPDSLLPPATHFVSTRYRMVFNGGPLFYACFNMRLLVSLLFRRRPVLLVAVDLDTLPANYLVSRLRGIPLLYDSHEYFTEVPELVGRRRVKRIWERIEKAIVPKLNFAMAVSESIAAVYREKYGTDFITVRNFARRYTAEPYPEFISSYPSKFRIIYQGALNRGRGIELLIDAMQYMEETLLFIAGNGDIRDALKQRVERLALQGKVVFTGRLTPGELRRITPGCDLGVSLEEDLGLNYRLALPNKIFDYIQAGIPVLCSNLPEMSAIVHQYRVGEVCISREPHELAKQMSGMLSDADARKQWKVNLKKAADELSWEREEQKLLDLVKLAAAGGL